MRILRKLLYPIVPIYYLITWFRNTLYDLGIKKSKSYDFPLIVVGNLSVGGTGKSPMIEYLITLIKDRFTVATLSRGYKRSTTGFQLVKASHNAQEIGDEPLQFKLKFKDVVVAVDADRQHGIEKLRTQTQIPEVILLDDAFQHRKVKAGCYILLTPFYDLYVDDMVLPSGNLREPRKGADRAHMIVVTKCPPDLSIESQKKIIERLKLEVYQDVYFTTIAYSPLLKNSEKEMGVEGLQKTNFTLITGIANPKPLVEFYESLGLKFEHLSFSDHHNFTQVEIEGFKKRELLVTTEKDYVRLKESMGTERLFYQPIDVSFLEKQIDFDSAILDYVKKGMH